MVFVVPESQAILVNGRREEGKEGVREGGRGEGGRDERRDGEREQSIRQRSPTNDYGLLKNSTQLEE